MEEGDHVPRIKKIPHDQEASEERGPLQQAGISEAKMDELTNKLDRVIRWNTFLTHTSLNAREQIDNVTNGVLDQDTAEFKRFRQKVMENNRSYKNKILSNFEVSAFDHCHLKVTF